MSQPEMSQPTETPPTALSVNITTIEQWLANNNGNTNYNKVLETLEKFKRRRAEPSSDDNSLKLNDDVASFISNNKIGDPAYDGGRRRKSTSSSRPRRRSSKKRGTQRKQKRRQRRGSRRAY